MKLLGLVGWSGSGKTTLLTALIPILIGRGLSVSTIKHAHHGFDMDRPGKDSFRHRQAGAREVMVASDTRWALLHEQEGDPAPLASLIARMQPVDLLLVEGFRGDPHPKIEIHRPALGKPPLWPEGHGIAAIATDAPVDCPLPTLDLNDPHAIAAWIVAD